MARLPGLREAEVDLARRGIRPAARDRLRPRVEVDPLGPVDVPVAEEGALPAAERVVRHGHGDGHVDPDHPDVHVELELPCYAAVTREERDAVAVWVLVHETERLVV